MYGERTYKIIYLFCPERIHRESVKIEICSQPQTVVIRLVYGMYDIVGQSIGIPRTEHDHLVAVIAVETVVCPEPHKP